VDVDSGSEQELDWQGRVDDFLAIRNPRFWANLDGLTVERAAALSVGIDPDGLDLLRDIQLSDQSGEEEVSLDFGDKQARYEESSTLIRTAITVGTLRTVNGLIPREDFRIWAQKKNLLLPSQSADHANDAVDVFLRDFLGATYQDFPRLKLAILAAREYAAGRVKTQPEAIQYLAEETGTSPTQSEVAKSQIVYVAQPDSRGRPGRRKT
jgi:hypothetical protein